MFMPSYPHTPEALYDNICEYLFEHGRFEGVSDEERRRFIEGLMTIVDQELRRIAYKTLRAVRRARQEQRSRTFNRLMNQLAHPSTPPSRYDDIPF
jgi:hypothetical protein